MKDYKARHGAPGRKPRRRIRPPAQQRGKAALPKGFRPLAQPESHARVRRQGAAPAAASGRLRRWRAAIGTWPVGRIVLTAAALWVGLGLASGAWALWQSPLEEVRLTGNEKLTALEVVRSAGVAAGMPLRNVDPYQVARRIVAHPQVVSADARARYPGQLLLNIRERQPALYVRLADGRTALVDGANVVLALDAPAADVPADLPTVAGVAGTAVANRPLRAPALPRARAVLAALTEVAFPDAQHVEVNVAHPVLTTVRLSGGVRLLIPEPVLEQALRTYLALLERYPTALRGMTWVDFSALRADGTGRVLLRR